MISRKNIFVLFIIYCIVVSLQPLNAQNTFVINGSFTGGTFDKLELVDVANIQTAIAVNTNSSGRFIVSSSTDFARFYYLKFDKYSLILIVHPGDTLDLLIDVNSVYDHLVVQGSQDTRLVYDALKEYNRYIKKLDSLNTAILASKSASQTDKMNQQITLYQSVAMKKDNFVKELILENSGSLACLLFIDNFKINKEHSLFDTLCKALLEKYPDNLFVKDFEGRVYAERFLAIGTEAPEITLPNPEGNMISLSSLRGRVVLIDFWASWCGPCRRENPNMVRIYQGYKDKGFEIYGVSLDNNRDKWLSAIASDHLTWIQVSDLKYWGSQAAQLYKVNSIPFTVLLDKQGKIIAKGLRGETLENILKEVLD